MLFFAYLLIKILVSWWTIETRSCVDLLRSKEFILGYWLIIPIGLTFSVSHLWSSIYTQRNLLISLPAVYLLLARAITAIPVKVFLQASIVFIFGALPLYHMVFIMGYYRYPYKEQFREAVEYIVDTSDQYPEAAIIGFSRFPSYFDYYFQHFNSDLRIDLTVQDETKPIEVAQFIENDMTPYFWIVVGHSYSDPPLVRRFEADFQVLEKVKLQGASVWLFKHQ
jgi:hypothetical protein